jgi:hypothetical protein
LIRRLLTLPLVKVNTKRLCIVLRQSPDWRNTPYPELIEGSRAFCRMIAGPTGLAENFISDVVEIWDRTFALPFFHVRAAMKDIAEENLAAVKSAALTSIASAKAGSASATAPLYLFIDDDDWLHPDLYNEIKPYLNDDSDGYIYGNILCVSHVELRRVEDGCYTNNYAVSRHYLQARSANFDRVVQHWGANEAFHQPDFHRVHVPLYLSATNKHPASTMKLKDGLQESELCAATLIRLIEKFVGETENLTWPPEAGWIAPYTKKVRNVFATLLLSRRGS